MSCMFEGQIPGAGSDFTVWSTVLVQGSGALNVAFLF